MLGDNRIQKQQINLPGTIEITVIRLKIQTATYAIFKKIQDSLKHKIPRNYQNKQTEKLFIS